ncbi:MAG: hypothetical protein ACXWUP_14285 [Allosphingosinicella sp.]
MVLKSVLTASVLALAIGAASSAAIGAGDPHAGTKAAGQAKTSEPDTSRRVCRNLTPSGTRMTRRTCRTQAEWNAAMDRTQDGVLQFQTKNQTTFQQSGGPL